MTAGPQDAPLLSLQSVSVALGARAPRLRILQDVSFGLAPGETLGIVGESGSGKTMMALAILGLLPPNQAEVTGQMLFAGRDLLALSPRELRQVRGRDISMIFQEPMSALDPVFTVGDQLIETIRAHRQISRKAAREMAVAALAEVGIPAARQRAADYPHQLSGGMRQRVMIAIALACQPKLLIADEPTTALDVTLQAQIIDLLVARSQDLRTALIFITHDFGVVARTCARMITMYAGQVVEDAPTDAALIRPLHPYTSSLLRSFPGLFPAKSRLPSIPGIVPSPLDLPPGCRFEPRCGYRDPRCAAPQILLPVDRERSVRCVRRAELELKGSLDHTPP